METLGNAKRSSNIELLRLFAAAMIVCSHLVQHSAENSFSIFNYANTINKGILIAIGLWGQLGVAIFVIISAWYMCEDKMIHSSKIMELIVSTWIICVLYTIGYNIFGRSVGGGIQTKYLLLELITPLYNKQYWFISMYCIYYMMLPFLQKLNRDMENNQLKKLVILLTLFVSVYNLLFEDVLGKLSVFICLFYLTSYVKRNPNFALRKRSVSWMVFIYLFIVIASLICQYIGDAFDIAVISGQKFRLTSWQQIFIHILAMCIFLSFEKMKIIRGNKVISLFASTTLGMYVLTENFVVSGFYSTNHINGKSILWEDVFHISNFATKPYFIIYVFAVVAVCCVVSGIVYKLIDTMVVWLINRSKVLKLINGKIDSFYLDIYK